jgi:hypothetical protein
MKKKNQPLGDISREDKTREEERSTMKRGDRLDEKIRFLIRENNH